MDATDDDQPSERDAESLYEPWVRIALSSPAWSAEKVLAAQELLKTTLHLGEVAERMRCSVFEVQAELKIGRLRDVRAYRRIRGLDPA